MESSPTVAVVSLAQKDQELVRLGLEARESAYCPYSKFPVGSAVRTKDGKYFKGCNVENASYPLCTCAERVAICNAVSQGSKEIEAISVVTKLDTFACPCGSCRQVICEFGYKQNCVIICADSTGKTCHKTDIQTLLPKGFTPENVL